MARPEPDPPADAALLDIAWLTNRRWFRSKSRSVAAVVPRDVAPLGDGPCRLLVLAVTFADGGEERYLVPAIEERGAWREPEDGEGAWRAVVRHMLAGDTVSGAAGSFSFRFEATGAAARLVPGGVAEVDGLSESRFSGEQSNTTVRIGDRLVLKVYRLIEAGTNPEVEVNAFLGTAGFRHAPVLAGSASYLPAGGTPAAAAMLQELVPARGDGWGWLLRQLAAPPDGPAEGLAAASLIGGITAELHAALASRPDDPAFPARAATRDELAAWQASAEAQLAAAVAILQGNERARLEAVAPAVAARLAGIGTAERAQLSRIHGDYHLGQLLRTETGFAVIDFEGEPARSLAERRAPSSPLRDVAGMLRSFDYAARSAARSMRDSPQPLAPPDAWVDDWLADAERAFLTAYGLADADRPLLAAFAAEKACYEVRYEADNRPDWTWLPLGALERLAAGPA
jgi:trehalose synthase-fused probable maltokinase